MKKGSVEGSTSDVKVKKYNITIYNFFLILKF